NYITEAWSFWEFDKKITSSGFGSTDTSVKIGEALNKIGTYSLKIGDRSILKNNTFCLLGTSDGYIHQLNPSSYSDDGVAIDGYIDTKSYVLSGIDVFSFLCQLVVFGKGYNLDVYISIDDGQNFVLVGELVQNRTTDSVSFLRKIDKTADKFMLRLRNNTNNEWFEVSGWELGYIRKKRVVKPILTYNITRITTSGIDRITSGGDNREISI
ncbi:MAG TPA: hypothetical protein VJ110_01025, partial [Candidatus Nanoarchaeia archaeon]|nr:hypothetical protein [Candidatus Nanoarchaeia archaeon]